MASRTDFGGWQTLNTLGKGGQGEVQLARKTSEARAPVPIDRVLETVRTCAGYVNPQDRQNAAKEFVSLIQGIASEVVAQDRAQLGALKLLHEIQDKSGAEKATARLNRELEALRNVQHPSLVRVIEAMPEEKWFVMDYFSRGTLSGHLGHWRGNVLEGLSAFRPLVAAVSELHKTGYIHRDIKPDNIFVGDDDRLVLGDFGLVIDPSASDPRLTDTYENVGSRDWMPGWALGVRMDEVRPSFDVFCLGKVLWSIISGRPRLRLWYFDRPEFHLEKMFPSNPDIRWVTRILNCTVVEHESECLTDAGMLLAGIDGAISALRYGGQVLGQDRAAVRCRMCGIGECQVQIPYDASDMSLHCNNCGHQHKFSQPKERPAWK